MGRKTRYNPKIIDMKLKTQKSRRYYNFQRREKQIVKLPMHSESDWAQTHGPLATTSRVLRPTLDLLIGF